MRINGDMEVDGSIIADNGSTSGPARARPRVYSETVGDQRITLASSPEAIDNMSAIEFPSTPDGVKRFKVTWLLECEEITLGNRRNVDIFVYVGPDGTGTGNDTVIRELNENLSDELWFIHQYVAMEVTPAVGDTKFGMTISISGEDMDVLGEGGTYTGARSILMIEELE
jgi:hypothetical protein